MPVADFQSDWFEMAILGCNNQVLRQIKIAVENDVKNSEYIIKYSVIKY